jgi:hypothetical protein
MVEQFDPLDASRQYVAAGGVAEMHYIMRGLARSSILLPRLANLCANTYIGSSPSILSRIAYCCVQLVCCH